jgi:hypothetical protein
MNQNLNYLFIYCTFVPAENLLNILEYANAHTFKAILIDSVHKQFSIRIEKNCDALHLKASRKVLIA